MGIDLRDLRLLPLECDKPELRYSHTILDCERDRDLWYVILRQPSMAAEPFSCFVGERVPDGEAKGEYMYGEATIDAYGAPYCFVTAGNLVQAFRAIRIWGRNNAILAYLAALPLETRVALDWH